MHLANQEKIFAQKLYVMYLIMVAKCGASPPEDNLISVLAVVVFNVFVPLHHIGIFKMK